MNYNYYNYTGLEYEDFDSYRNANMFKVNIFSPMEAFAKGNLFKDLYVPYNRNLNIDIIPRDEQEKLLNELSAHDLVAHDLNLYLCVYPNDKNAIDLFNKYSQKSNELKEEYIKKYGTLKIIGSSESHNQKWPWEVM